MYETIKRLMDTRTVVYHPRQGCPCTNRTKMMVQIVAARIQWNPVKKQSVIARELNISKMFRSGMLRSDPGLKTYQQSTSHFLTLHLKEQRVIKSKWLFNITQTMARGEFLFTDENIFHIEEVFNRQIDWVYASSTSQETHEKSPRIQRDHYPASVMVLLGVSYDATTKLHFCEKGAKMSAKIYENTVLETVVKPFNNTLFSNEYWSFKQDLTPACKANSTKVWLPFWKMIGALRSLHLCL